MALSSRGRRIRRVAVLAAVWLLPSAFFVALSWSVYAHFRIDPPVLLSPEARTEAMRVLRLVVDRRGPAERPSHPELERALAERGPVIVSLWRGGSSIVRISGYGDTLADAVEDAARALQASPSLERMSTAVRTQARIKVDVVSGRGPLALDNPLLRALSVQPGLEGLTVRVRADSQAPAGDGPVDLWLLPDELIAHRLFGRSTPLSFVPDFRIGLDFKRVEELFSRQAKERFELDDAAYRSSRRAYQRFRTVSFIEAPHTERDGRAPIALERGLSLERPPLTPESLRAAAVAGGRFLVDHLAPNGRYIYERDLASGRGSSPKPGGPYSIPRHAGTTYFLAELYRLTGESFLREPIERAFAHLSELIAVGGCHGTLPYGPLAGQPFACVLDRGHSHAHLGSTALTVVALVEYRRATDDPRYDTMARQLTEWILFMQRPDGSFAHVYDTKTQEQRPEQLLYYSGEAALALARMHSVFGEERYRDAAARALDHIVGWYDEFFLGGFFFGEEHWTCIAAEAIHPAVDTRRYLAFCQDYARFLRDQQIQPGEFADQAQYVGSYNVTPFIMPQNTPAGSRTESMISTYLLLRAHGRADDALRAQIEAALGYTLGQQIRADHDYFVSQRVRGAGAITAGPADWSVRIDYVQHACSALIRGIEVIDQETAP